MIENLREEVFKLNAHNCILFDKKETMTELEFVGYLISKDLMLILEILTDDNFDKQKDGHFLSSCFERLGDKIHTMDFRLGILQDKEMRFWFDKGAYLNLFVSCRGTHRMNDSELSNFRNKVLYIIKEKATYIKENILKDKGE